MSSKSPVASVGKATADEEARIEESIRAAAKKIQRTDELNSTAPYHEAGHALCAALLGRRLISVTIGQDGDRAGSTRIEDPLDCSPLDGVLETRQIECAIGCLDIALAGRIAEQLHLEDVDEFCGERCSGDMERARTLAMLICGGDGPATARLIEVRTNAIRSTLDLPQNREAVTRLASALTQSITLSGEQALEILGLAPRDPLVTDQ